MALQFLSEYHTSQFRFNLILSSSLPKDVDATGMKLVYTLEKEKNEEEVREIIYLNDDL